jgi:hypothetical protein
MQRRSGNVCQPLAGKVDADLPVIDMRVLEGAVLSGGDR